MSSCRVVKLSSLVLGNTSSMMGWIGKKKKEKEKREREREREITIIIIILMEDNSPLRTRIT